MASRAGFIFRFDGAGEHTWDPRSDQVQLGRDLVLVLDPPYYAGSMEPVEGNRQEQKVKWITSPPCFNNAVTSDRTYMDPGTRDCRIRTGCAVQSLIDAAVMLPAEHKDLKTAVKVPGTNFCLSMANCRIGPCCVSCASLRLATMRGQARRKPVASTTDPPVPGLLRISSPQTKPKPSERCSGPSSTAMFQTEPSPSSRNGSEWSSLPLRPGTDSSTASVGVVPAYASILPSPRSVSVRLSQTRHGTLMRPSSGCSTAARLSCTPSSTTSLVAFWPGGWRTSSILPARSRSSLRLDGASPALMSLRQWSRMPAWKTSTEMSTGSSNPEYCAVCPQRRPERSPGNYEAGWLPPVSMTS